MRKEAERLILQARRDLVNARKNIGIEAYEVAAFLCHQAVEKYLKGAWIQKKRARPPATHYLRELGQGLRIPNPLLRHLAFLNPDYTVTRDPDAANGVPYELYDEATALVLSHPCAPGHRASTLLADLDLALPADVLCYTPEEFARKRRELGILSLALEEGLRLR